MNPFSQYIKAIGKGQRAGRYLTQSEAHDAFEQLLTGRATPEQAGAFLMLLRVREESVEELAGFVSACRQHLSDDYSHINATVDMGCYSGKRRHLPWFLLAVKCMAEQGERIFLHGTTEPESKRLYLHDVFTALSLPISQDAQHAKSMLDKQGFCYVNLADCHPQLHQLIALRTLFGLRSCANTLARMLNPSRSPISYHGVFHREFDERHIHVAQLLNDDNVSCIRGEGGEVEVNPEREFIQHIARNGESQAVSFPILLAQWQVKPRELNPQALVEVWTETTEDAYAHQAVIGTLATYLVQLNNIDVTEALAQAKNIWLARNRDFYASIN